MNCAVVGSDGKTMVTGGPDATIRLWNVAKAAEMGKSRLVHQPGPLSAIALAPNGLLITAGGSHSKEMHLWDLVGAEAAFQGLLMPSSPIHLHSLAFSKGASYLVAGGGDGMAVVWDMSNKTELLALSGHTGNVLAVAFSPDGKIIATGDGSKVRLWDLRNPRSPLVLDGHALPVLGLSFAPDGKRLASASQDMTVRVWDLTVRPPSSRVLSGHTNQVTCVQFSPDGQILVSGGLDNKVRSWDQADGREFPDDRYSGHTAAVSSVAFSPDGNFLATADQKGQLYLRSLHADRKTPYQFPVPITALAYAADSRHLAVATANSAVYVLRVAAPPGNK
jgi:WD40 repeat protein